MALFSATVALCWGPSPSHSHAGPDQAWPLSRRFIFSQQLAPSSSSPSAPLLGAGQLTSLTSSHYYPATDIPHRVALTRIL
ncbi:hypothetical protein BO71DRAFT_395613, partial [Aspergillus ellipticus CBS 707.79]